MQTTHQGFDILVIRKNDDTETAVYRKCTDKAYISTGSYIHLTHGNKGLFFFRKTMKFYKDICSA